MRLQVVYSAIESCLITHKYLIAFQKTSNFSSDWQKLIRMHKVPSGVKNKNGLFAMQESTHKFAFRWNLTALRTSTDAWSTPT